MIASTLTSLTHEFSPTAMHSLGWALLHFLWQGTAVAALAAGAMALCRQASARYAVAVGALVVMLLAPPLTFLLYSQAHSVAPSSAALLPHGAGTWPAVPARTTNVHNAPALPELDALPWLVEAWLVGVAFFSLRSAGGFLWLERERRRQSSVVNARLLEICHTLQDQMGIRRAIQYCECKWMQAPAVIGWLRPIVFLPVTALTGLSEEQLESVIAHELAHIRRQDAFVNVFQVCVETLLFYHPGVWWLNKRIRDEREHCCDETAVSFCGNPVEYARALTLMEEWRSAPGFAMAANRGPLTERIVRVLGLKPFGAATRGIGLAGSALCLAAALIAGNALLGMAHPPSARVFAAMQATPTSSASPAAQAAGRAKPSPAHAQSGASQASAAATATSASSYVDAMKSTGLGDLTVDQLIALKIQDVTPEYVRELQAQGLHLNVDRLIAMRIQDVTPEYVRAFREAGLNPDEDQLISLKIQDADAAYYRALRDAGIECDVNRLVAMKIQDVTPQYVRDLRASGLTVSAEQVLALKIQDVTPGYLKEMHDLGIEPRTDDAIAMRIQDVTPEYVRQIHALGLKPSTQELISMRIQDVTPEYIKALQSAGFRLEIDEIVRAKIQDVTPEFIEQAHKHGFKDLTLQKLIQLRQLGILDSKADL